MQSGKSKTTTRLERKYEVPLRGKRLDFTILSFDVQQVSRVENAKVNAISKQAASLPTDLWKKIFFEVLKKSSFEEPQVQPIDEETS